LDFQNRCFKNWNQLEEENIEIYSTIYIRRNFKDYFDKSDSEKIDYLEEKIFKPLFADKSELGLQFLSRGLAGHYEDKSWGALMGNCNSGKGVIDGCLNYALQDYYTTVKSENFICEKFKGGDNERAWAWALDLQFARIALLQEIPSSDAKSDIKLNGECFKKICSGGDTQKARRPFGKSIIEFVIQARLMLMCNDIPPISGKDAMETCLEVHSSATFLDKDVIDEMKKNNTSELIMKDIHEKDANIKQKIETEEYANALIMLLYQKYVDKAVSLKTKEEISRNKEENNNENKSLRAVLLDNIVLNSTHSITNEDLNEIATENNFNVSPKKISIELVGIGLKSCKIGKKRGWKGASLKPIEKESELIDTEPEYYGEYKDNQ